MVIENGDFVEAMDENQSLELNHLELMVGLVSEKKQYIEDRNISTE